MELPAVRACFHLRVLIKFHLLVGALALVAAACGTGAPPDRSTTAGNVVELDQIESSPRENVPSALTDPAGEGLPKPLVDPADIISGGPPPDGIPTIDKPKFQKASSVDWLEPKEAVLSFQLGDEIRAYPAQILIWHEIVNDTVAGQPVTITYCPLCNSGVAFNRRLGDRVLDFGTSGKLLHSALVMYDRQTESLWAHFEGRAIAGFLTGANLELLPVSTVSWEDWRRKNPSSWVLSRDTGHKRDYGRNPYEGYDDQTKTPFLFKGEPDPRMPGMARVVGIRNGRQSVAIVLDHLGKTRVVHTKVGDLDVVAWSKPGLASALDSGTVAMGREIAATGVFDTRVGKRHLTFRASGGGFVDKETGTTWDLFGAATSGPLTGEQLTALEHVDTFWFAWAAYLPDTKVIGQ